MWEKFNIRILTIPTSNFPRIKDKMEKAGIQTYKIHTYPSAKKTSNKGGKNIDFLDILAHDHIDETSLNITRNHVNVISESFAEGLENVLILEDDVEFSVSSQKLEKIQNWISNNNWDILYFGHCPWPIIFNIPVAKDIVKTFSPLLAHCYLLNRRGMSKVIQTYRKKKLLQFERLLQASNLRSYAVLPSIAYQIDPPGLYSNAVEKLNLPCISHNKVFYSMEIIAVCMPIIISMILVWVCIKWVISIRTNEKLKK